MISPRPTIFPLLADCLFVVDGLDEIRSRFWKLSSSVCRMKVRNSIQGSKDMSLLEESVGSSPSVLLPSSAENISPTPESTPRDFRNPYFEFHGTCYRCKKEGHMARYCSQGTTIHGEQVLHNNNVHIPPIQCPCGAGSCHIKTSNTPKNPRRQFYTCPANSGQKCKYFKWCDHVKNEDIVSSGPVSSVPITDIYNQRIECPCGAGICIIKTSHTLKNPNRRFYKCPAQDDQNCKFFQWCNEVKNDEVVLSSFEYPMCACGAGKCRISTANTRNYVGQKTFVCPVKKGHGACNFVKQVDEIIVNRSLENDEISITQSNPSNTNSEVSQGMETVPQEICLLTENRHDNEIKSPSVDLNKCFGDEANEDISVLPKPSIGEPEKHKNSLHSLVPYVEASSIGVFPSFDPVASLAVNNIEDKDSIRLKSHPLVPRGDQQLITATQSNTYSYAHHPSPSQVPEPCKLQGGSSPLPSPFLDVFREAAVQIQNKLVTLLETMDPLDDEGMMREASSAFAALDCLKLDCEPFRIRVIEFISRVTSIRAKIEQQDPGWDHGAASKELVDWCVSKQYEMNDLTHVCARARAMVTSFKERLEILRGEAVQLRAMLVQFEGHLSCCEAKTVDMETKLELMSHDMLESERMVHLLWKDAQEALRESEGLENERNAVMEALDQSRIQLWQDNDPN